MQLEAPQAWWVVVAGWAQWSLGLWMWVAWTWRSLAGPSAGWLVATCGVVGGTAVGLVHLHHQDDHGPGMGCVQPSVGAADWVWWAEPSETPVVAVSVAESVVVAVVVAVAVAEAVVWVWAGLG